MEVLSTTVNAAVIGLIGLLLSPQIRRIDRDINLRFEQVDRRFDSIEVRLDAMRSDLTNVALRGGGGPRTEAG